MPESRTLKLTLTKSLHGRTENHQACARGLGIRRIHNPVTVADTPENRGMIERIRYMLMVEEGGTRDSRSFDPAQDRPGTRKKSKV